VAGKAGIRVQVEFTKKDGKASSFWTAAPEKWDVMGDGEKDAWVSRTAHKRHRGAQNARVVRRG
jgi:hypothetical protein